MNERIRFSRLFEDSAALMRANAPLIVTTWAVMVIAYVALSRLPDDLRSGDTLVSSMSSLVAQLLLTRQLLIRLGMMQTDRSSVRILAMFGMNLVSGLAIILGMVLLLIPGLYLAARWSASAPILIAEDRGVGDSLSESWRRTADAVWPIVGALLLIWSPTFAVVAFGGVLGGNGVPALLTETIADAAMAAGSVVGWCVAVSVYGQLRPRLDELEQVFA